jgi:hypothetical protein
MMELVANLVASVVQIVGSIVMAIGLYYYLLSARTQRAWLLLLPAGFGLSLVGRPISTWITGG